MTLRLRLMLLCLAFSVFSRPTYVFAQSTATVWISPYPYGFNPGDTIDLYWGGTPGDPAFNECELPDEYVYYAYVSGDDGFQGSDEQTTSYQAGGDLQDLSADTTRQGSWGYSLYVWVNDECEGQEGRATASERSNPPRPTWLSSTDPSGADYPCDATGCNGSYAFGSQRWYQVMDQWGSPFGGVTLSESVQLTRNDCPPSVLRTGTPFSSDDGRFMDLYGICGQQCCENPGSSICQVEANQTLYVNGNPIGWYYLAMNCQGLIYITP